MGFTLKRILIGKKYLPWPLEEAQIVITRDFPCLEWEEDCARQEVTWVGNQKVLILGFLLAITNFVTLEKYPISESELLVLSQWINELTVGIT